MKMTPCRDWFCARRLAFTGLAGLVILSFVLAGCSPEASAPPPPAPAGDKNKVTIKGSNTIGEELAPRLVTEFKKDHPQVVVEIEAKNTGSGFWGLIAGVCDIGAASRPIIKDEQQQCSMRNLSLNEYVIGSYSVAVVANAGCPVADLKKSQVRDIFTGVITNWKDVGGPDVPIHLYIRNPVSGTYLGFQELAMENKAYTTNNLTELESYAKIADAVSKDTGGIGYVSMDLLAKPEIKGVAIEGVAPAVATVKDGKYPYARVLRFYTVKGRESDLTGEFVKYVSSDKGQAVVAQMGYVPAKP